jgi:hypothetical protein
VPPRRYQEFEQNRAPVWSFPPAEPVPAPTPEQIRIAEDKQRLEALVKARRVEHVGADNSFVKYGVLNPIGFPAVGRPARVVTFTVPSGRILLVDRVEWWCSEPYLYGNGQFAWRMSIDGRQIPYWSSQYTDVYGAPAVRRTDYFQIPFAPLLGNEPRFKPVAVQRGETLVVELIEALPGPTGFHGQAWAAAYVYGELRKPAGEEVL